MKNSDTQAGGTKKQNAEANPPKQPDTTAGGDLPTENGEGTAASGVDEKASSHIDQAPTAATAGKKVTAIDNQSEAAPAVAKPAPDTPADSAHTSVTDQPTHRTAGGVSVCLAPSPDGTSTNRIFVVPEEIEGLFTRADAVDLAANLEFDGFRDYRLPTEAEADALVRTFGTLLEPTDDTPFWTATDADLEHARVFTLGGTRRTVHVSSLARVVAIRTEPLVD